MNVFPICIDAVTGGLALRPAPTIKNLQYAVMHVGGFLTIRFLGGSSTLGLLCVLLLQPSASYQGL